MIKTEDLGMFVRHYSDAQMMIRQVETNDLYEDAVNTKPCQYTYEETDTPIPDHEIDDETVLSYLMGKRETMTWQQAQRFRDLIDSIIDGLSDENALEVTELFMPWLIGKDYSAGDKVKYNDALYRCVQGHTSQEMWTPDITAALWTRVSVDEWPEWIQPTGSQDAYRIDAKVSHNDKHWINVIDYNTYAPGVYGWDEVV